MDMEFINSVVLSKVPKKAKRILDLGCGDDRMARKLIVITVRSRIEKSFANIDKVVLKDNI